MDNGASSYRRFLDGDDTGLVEIIQMYKDGLTLYLNSFAENIFTAEEWMEDTFFKLAVKKPRFSGKSSFKTWLYAIGRNLAIDRIRQERHTCQLPPEALENLRLEEESVERAYFREERRIQLHRALRGLKREYRQVLLLTYFEGLTNREAARLMKKTVWQIENLLYRAKLSLRKNLEQEGFVYEEQ